jgi:dTDP-4-dehydrorhamnose reductase
MATLAIIGAGGVLGAKLVEAALRETSNDLLACTHGAVPRIPAASSPRVRWMVLDIADAEAVRAAITQARPYAVITSAAMTNVDACETQRERAYAANVAGPEHIARACVEAGAALTHVSTDYVFPGEDAHPGPYVEGDPVGPVNYYGQTKLEGERAVERICAGQVPWLVARTALVYGYVPGGRTNFIRWLAGELRAGRRVKVVNDQFNTPTLAEDLAAVLLSLTQRSVTGVIHLAGPDLVSRVEWARAIAGFYGLDESLIDITTTAALGQPARRPLRSGLRTIRGAELGGMSLRGIQAGLEALSLEQGEEGRK